ncbi:MAG: hypothetical protein QF464_15900, partial [Myxococcota bacterium]|nr:hypothetical protein [Myxococcota bacterium]
MSYLHRPLYLVLISALCLGLTTAGCAEDTGGGGGSSGGATVEDFAVRLSVCGHARVDLIRDLYLNLSLTLNSMSADNSYTTVLNDMVQCVGSAGDCPAVWTCLNVDTTKTCEPTPDTCEGTAKVGCVQVDGCGSGDIGWVEETDCSDDLGGNTLCIETVSSEPSCGAGTCDSDYEVCDDEVLERCSYGVIERTDCSDLGAVCSSHIDGDGVTELRCVFKDNTECTEDHCNDGLLVDCASGHEVAFIDCARIATGLTCVTDADVGPNCRTLEAAEC